MPCRFDRSQASVFTAPNGFCRSHLVGPGGREAPWNSGFLWKASTTSGFSISKCQFTGYHRLVDSHVHTKLKRTYKLKNYQRFNTTRTPQKKVLGSHPTWICLFFPHASWGDLHLLDFVGPVPLFIRCGLRKPCHKAFLQRLSPLERTCRRGQRYPECPNSNGEPVGATKLLNEVPKHMNIS